MDVRLFKRVREAKPAPVVGERAYLRRGCDANPERRMTWDQLVPDSGQCQTPQGEVIHRAGRPRGVRQRWHQLGSLFKVADQYLAVVRSSSLMPPASVARAERRRRLLKSRSYQAVDDITELAVEWVRLNPVLVEANLPGRGAVNTGQHKRYKMNQTAYDP